MESATAADERPPERRRPARTADAPRNAGPFAYAAEVLGTFALVLAVTLIVTIHSGDGLGVTDWAVIGLVHVFILALLVYAFGGTSGAHFNPAVTIALLVGRKIRPPDALIYIVCQLLGAVLAALVTKLLLEDEGRAVNYGATGISDAPEAPAAAPGQPPPPSQGADFLGGSVIGALVAEALATLFLMWAIMATAVDPRGPRNVAGWVIGATLGAMVMVFGPLTGGSMNPARSFGPALVGGEFADFWVYVIGPVVGAVLAYLLYMAVVLRPEHRGPGDRPVDHLD